MWWVGVGPLLQVALVRRWQAVSVRRQAVFVRLVAVVVVAAAAAALSRYMWVIPLKDKKTWINH